MILSILFFLQPVSVWAEKLEVFVSILPQKFLVERIGGDVVHVSVMVKPGQSPETFEPSPKLMSLYANSNVYFTIGLPFEQVWIKRVASLNHAASIVHTEVSSLHEPTPTQGGHGHEFDPHTWLSPSLFLQQGELVLAELIRLSPQNKARFTANYQTLFNEVGQLHHELQTLFTALDKHAFITFHPAFSYFAKQYGLTQLAIEVAGKEPSAKQIAQIISSIKGKNVRYILIEKQFNQVIAKTIAQSIHAQLLVLDPLAFDYLANMRDIAYKINKALF